MDGVVILETYQVFKAGEYFLLLFAIAMLVCVIFGIIHFFRDGAIFSGLAAAFFTIIVGILTIFAFKEVVKSVKTDVYDVYLEEDVNMEEFFEQYEIIEDHGAYFSVIKKENSEE